MTKIINGFFSILKFILLLIGFVMSFYVVLSMYQKFEKSYFDAISIFLPFLILLILLILNHVLVQKEVTENIFYNLTCCVVFGLLILVSYRTMCDSYMLVSIKNNYNMSFQYFSDMIAPFKSMMYLLIASNVCLILTKNNKKLIVEKPKKSKSKKTTKAKK